MSTAPGTEHFYFDTTPLIGPALRIIIRYPKTGPGRLAVTISAIGDEGNPTVHCFTSVTPAIKDVMEHVAYLVSKGEVSHAFLVFARCLSSPDVPVDAGSHAQRRPMNCRIKRLTTAKRTKRFLNIDDYSFFINCE